MGLKPIELRAVWKNEDGTEAVQTGIYVFESTTLGQVRELMDCYRERGERVPTYVEFDMTERLQNFLYMNAYRIVIS